MKIYENLNLNNLEGEIWVDVIGYDGIYEISNLGRIKSLRREKITRWGTGTMIEERILKQTHCKENNNLQICLCKKSYSVHRLVYRSFYPNVRFAKNECVMHINKNLIDNRLINLEKTDRKTSKMVDMRKSIPTIIAVPKNLDKAIEANKEFYNKITHKECTVCGKIDLIENFPASIQKCQKCVNNYVKNRRANFKYVKGEKQCVSCKVIKDNKDFPKLDNYCKKCRHDLHQKYVNEQRENLGDWYVKKYGKENYGIKEFTPALIEELRKEIKEKRKPKHIFDGISFNTTREFALYIQKKYKISLYTVENRLSRGFTEKECILNRRDFIWHNKNKSQ